MNLEEFRHLKQKMMNIINILEEYDKTNIELEGVQKEIEKLIQNYLELQSQLLENDLSDIPYEEWEGLMLFSKELDFSKTHANIDFSLLRSIAYESINLNGCNVRGMEVLDYDENTFGEEFIKSNPDYFPDESIPKEIRDKFFKKELQFSDLIEYPSLKKCVTKYSFGNSNNPSGALVAAIGIESALKLFNEYPLFVKYITTKNEEHSYRQVDYSKEKIEKDKSYEDKKEFVYECVIKSLRKSFGIDFPPMEIIPQDMKEKFPSVFIIDGELPEEVTHNYYSGKLSIEQIRNYQSVLKTKDIMIGIRNSNYPKDIVKVFDSVWDFIDKIPKELDYTVLDYISGTFGIEEKIKNMELEDIITASIRNSIQRNHFPSSIYDIITYCKYLPIEEVVLGETTRDFISKCGLTTLQDYNRKNDYVFDKSIIAFRRIEDSLLGYMALYSEQLDEEILINSEDELKIYLEKIIVKMRKSDDYHIETLLEQNKNELLKMFPNQFLDYDLVVTLLGEISEYELKSIFEKLNSGFNGEVEELLNIINKYPVLSAAIDGRELIIKEKYKHLYKVMLDTLGQKKFIEINSLYGSAIIELINNIPEESFKKLLDEMKNNENYFETLNDKIYMLISSNRNFDIRNLPESFKKLHPELYLNENAPKKLAEQFYGIEFSVSGVMSLVNLKDLQENPDWIHYLQHIDLDRCLEKKLISVYNSNDGNKEHYTQQMSIYKALSMKFSQTEILNIFSEYGDILWNINYLSLNIGLEKNNFYENILEGIYKQIVSRNVAYRKDMPESFKIKYFDLFLDKNAPDELQNLFYQRKVSPEIIQLHPEFIPFLLDKNIKAICDRSILNFIEDASNIQLSNEKVFELFSKYGNYLSTCKVRLNSEALGHEEEFIKKQIINSITKERTSYDESAQAIIGIECPDLFLDKNAPDELKQHFYNTANIPLTFELLKQHKEWLPFLKDKNVLLSLKKKSIGIGGLEKLFEKYGQEQAIKIGIKNPESVMKMLSSNNFELFSQWYDKLNFVPHYVVMLEFPIEQSDKFIAAGKKWSQLMRIERHNLNEESKSALLKASMCFGVFDSDIEGFNKVIQLFTDIPKTISEIEMNDLINSLVGKEEYKKELEILNKIYGKNDDGNYTLKINSQHNKEDVNLVRGLMEKVGFKRVLTPDLAHKLFGGFIMKYDPTFRDFILNNMDTILQSDEYIAYISSIQKQWSEIRTLNSNRVLTLDLALAFVKSNGYKDIQVGNEKLAEVSNMAGYSQQDFDTLQQIYNYGRQRVFSSIPRIKTTSGQYTYEILKLDDPLAVAIGTLTDCCQELGNIAETCMEHSMVDKHGRVFVIKDTEGNIVAQSWMWRNKNVVCFDNIEIPAKAFTRSEREGTTRKEFADIVFNLYKQASEELMEKDELVYSRLLEEGKITQEQYEALKIGKITVGTGYNDIADSLKRNAKKDTSTVARPLEFTAPVKLKRDLYISDSLSQYIIAGDQDVIVSKEETPTLYQDEFLVYDNTNIKEQDVLSLRKLEYITKKDYYTGCTESDKTENIISDIAYNYNLKPETTRIVKNANFAIIYDTREDSIIIGDLLYNTSVDINNQKIDITDKVLLQIRMAIEQISIEGKDFDISRLNQEQIDMYNKAMALNEEIDIERGVSRGAR